jgi:muconate cycloisomerase
MASGFEVGLPRLEHTPWLFADSSSMTKHMQVQSAPAKRKGERPPLLIRRVDAIPVALPLSKPMRMAGVTITHAQNILVRIESADGMVGWGEAASAPTMTGDTLGGLVCAVRDHLAPLLSGEDAWQRPTLVRRLRAALLGNTGAHSAVELALIDLAGRSAGLRAVELMGGAFRKSVAPMWLLGNATPQEDIAEAQAKQKEGFNCFKLKVGAKALDEDIATTHAVRKELTTAVPVCADANCGFTSAAARRYLDETRQTDLLFLEQPLGHTDLKGLTALARFSPIPIGADEGIHSIVDVEAHAKCGVGGISLKLIKLGGFSVALEAAQRAHRLGLALNVAAKIAESSIASAAAIHLACAVPTIDWGVSLTHFYLTQDIVKTPLGLRNGLVHLPAAPGLGVDVDEDAIARFRVHKL